MNNRFIDIHSHILWGIDDGSQSIDETIDLCDIAFDNGTDSLIVTPHLMYWEKAGELYDERNRKFEILSEILEEEGIPLDLKKGFEILCDDDIFDIKYFDPYTLCDSRYILIEFDFFRTYEDDVQSWCEYLKSFGLVPIIAHPERYEFLLTDPSAVDRLSGKGVLFQVNSGSAAGMFGEDVQDFAVKMIVGGYADFIGSDAHDVRVRNTDIAFCIENYPAEIDDNILRNVVLSNSLKLLKDEKIKPQRRFLFSEI